MKNLFHSGLLAFALICGFSVFTGCQTTQPTAEAVKYNTLRATWTVALSAHDVYSEMVVLGKVKPADQADVNRAWDDFRAAFKVAALLAERDLSSATPDNVERLKDDLIILIRSL